jgi:hypothetical protein
MDLLRRFRLPVALAIALTLMACAARPPTETSVFDTLARAEAVEQRQTSSCDPRFEIRSCTTHTGMRFDQSCTCISRDTLREGRHNTF